MTKRSRRSVPLPPVREATVDSATGRLAEVRYAIPPPLTDPAWTRLYLSVRAAVARKYPGLLPAWDKAGADLHFAAAVAGLKRDQKIRLKKLGVTTPTLENALAKLCKILEDPEAAKNQKFTSEHIVLYERVKEILTHCRRLRRDAERKRDPMLSYTAADMPWSSVKLGLGEGRSWPGPPVRRDSPELYRIALQEVFWPWWTVPDETLKQCVTLWRRPHQAAVEVLGALTSLSPQYVERRVYTRSTLSRS